MQSLPNRFQDVFGFSQYLVVPETQGANALGLQRGIALAVALHLFGDLPTIEFDTQLGLVAVERCV